MKKTRMEKGITLVALIITIVVLLILATVAINSIQNEGIIGHAESAADKYTDAEAQEKAALLETEYFIASKLGSTSTTKTEYVLQNMYGSDLKLGAEVDYNDGVSTYDGSWKILGIKDGRILLMSTKSVGTKELSGVDGYNNGITYLNDICAPYGTGKGAALARSITAEDINAIVGYNPSNPKNNGKPSYYDHENEYGAEITYTYVSPTSWTILSTNSAFPNGTYSDAGGFTLMNGKSLSEVGTFKETTTFYTYELTNSSDYYENSATDHSKTGYILMDGADKGNIYNMIYPTAVRTPYWLATQAAVAKDKYASYGFLEVNATDLNGNNIWVQRSTSISKTNGETKSKTCEVRCVVELKAGVKLVDSNNDGKFEIK